MINPEEGLQKIPSSDEGFWEYVPSEFIVFDLETTGLESRKDRILEIGASLFIKEDYLKTGEVITYQCFIKQEKKIPYEITKINGITDDMVVNGDSEYEALTNFFDFVADRPLFAYNSKFDRSFIIAAAKRSKYLLEIDTFEVEDILVEAKKYFSHLPNRKLSTIAKHTGFTLTGEAHRAVHDSAMALHVYISIRQLWYKKIFGSLKAMGIDLPSSLRPQNAKPIPTPIPIPTPQKMYESQPLIPISEELISSPIDSQGKAYYWNLFFYGGMIIAVLVALLLFTSNKKGDYESRIRSQCMQTANQEVEESRKKAKGNNLDKKKYLDNIYETSLATCIVKGGLKK